MDTASSSMKAFEKMEQKADQMLDTANSMAELEKEPEDEATTLEAKYENVNTSVEDELEKMKKEMGL